MADNQSEKLLHKLNSISPAQANFSADQLSINCGGFSSQIDLTRLISPHSKGFFEKIRTEGKPYEGNLVRCLAGLAALAADRRVTFYDLGAAFGYHSKIALDFFGSESRVVAVEANHCSAAVVAKHRRVEIKSGLLSINSSKKLVVFDGFSIYEFSLKALSVFINRFIKYSLEQLSCLIFKNESRRKTPAPRWALLNSFTLMEILCRPGNQSIEIMKIDVEGYQAEFLPPNLEMLVTRKVILLLELDSPKKMARFGSSNNDLLRLCIDSGYAAFWIDHKGSQEDMWIQVELLDPAKDRNSLLFLIPLDHEFLDSVC